MPTVLLITDQARVRQLFTGMEQEELFRLRIAPTLAQGEEEVAVRRPDFIFVQNHISGLSGAIIVRYLRGLLPEGAEVILLVRDAEDAVEIVESAGTFLDLSEEDDSLRRAIRGLLPRAAPPQPPPPAEPSPAPPKSTRELLLDERDREEPPAKADRRLLWLIPLALIVVSLSVVAYRAGRKSPPSPAPQTVALAPEAAVTPEPGAAAPAAKKVLPPFIAAGVGDPAFGQSHPGWERYLGPSCEFRVYREALAIKALQVWARPEPGTVPAAVFNAALKEVAGIATYQVVTREQAGDYVVERGIGSGGVALTVYRSNPDLALRAFTLQNQAPVGDKSFDIDLAQLPPPKGAAPSTVTTVTAPGAASSPPGAASSPPGAAKPATATSPAGPGAIAPSGRYHHYVVQPGDNLFKILVKDYGYTPKEAEEVAHEIKQLNGLTELKRLQPGQRIVIPAKRSRPEAESR